MKGEGRIAKDLATLRGLGKRERREFIWDYYKIPILALASILALAALSLAAGIGRGSTVLYAVLVNADDTGNSAVFSELLAQSGIDMDGKQVDVSAGYTLRYDGMGASDGETIQVLAALFGIGDLDLFAADQPVFDSYASQGAFVDLGLFIGKEELARQELYLYEDSNGHQAVAGIWLREGSPLHRAGYFAEDVVIGVAAQAQNLDPAVALLGQLAAVYSPKG